jgi:hypothetical protein
MVEGRTSIRDIVARNREIRSAVSAVSNTFFPNYFVHSGKSLVICRCRRRWP